MFRKRLRAYKKIGYHISESAEMKPDLQQGIFEGDQVMPAFERDVLAANREIIISSPGLNLQRVDWLLNLVPELYQRNISITVLTLSAESYPKERQEAAQKLIDALKKADIWVKASSQTHEHFAVIDRQVVWYGSVNLLSRLKEEEDMLRLRDKTIAKELLHSLFY